MSSRCVEFLDFLSTVDDLNMMNNNRARIIRPRPEVFNNYDDYDFFKRYRMSKELVLFILNQIDEKLEYESDRNDSIPPVNQLLIALRYYATGNNLMSIGDMHGVDISTVSRIVKRVSNAIVELRPNFINMPTSEEEIEQCQRAFYDIANFPFVVGTLDCTHVRIQSPGGSDAELFRSRKGYFSINVQTVSDAELKVRNVVARWPGSTHDSAIFRNSLLCRYFEEGQFGRACLLGDNGYASQQYMLTPYLNPTTNAQEHYNSSHIKTRNTVERQYGLLKRRFPVLAIGMKIRLETAISVIISCCVLHNLCIGDGEGLPPNEMNENYLNRLITEGQIDHNYTHDSEDTDRRSLITNAYFS